MKGRDPFYRLIKIFIIIYFLFGKTKICIFLTNVSQMCTNNTFYRSSTPQPSPYSGYCCIKRWLIFIYELRTRKNYIINKISNVLLVFPRTIINNYWNLWTRTVVKRQNSHVVVLKFHWKYVSSDYFTGRCANRPTDARHGGGEALCGYNVAICFVNLISVILYIILGTLLTEIHTSSMHI